MKVVIIGATSAIAEATARLYAAEGAEFFITGRNSNHLEIVAQDLTHRGAAKVQTALLDVARLDTHVGVLDRAFASPVDLVLVAHGTLSDQKGCEASVDGTVKELTTNFVATAALLTPIANRLQRGAVIAVISSVAGDRGRQSNYVYGSAKGGLSIFLEGLRNRLYASGIHVVTIKPGFVDTPMTAGLSKGPLYVKPEVIARGIKKAVEHRKDVAYLPGRWRAIMTIIRMIPEPLFKRMKL